MLSKLNMTLHPSSFWHWVIAVLLLCVSIPTCACYSLALPLLLVERENNTRSMTKNWKIYVFKTVLMQFSLVCCNAKGKLTVLVNTEGKYILRVDFCFCRIFFPPQFWILNFHFEQWSGVCIEHQAPPINLNEDTFPLVEEMMWIISCQWNQTFGEQFLIKIDTYNEKRA